MQEHNSPVEMTILSTDIAMLADTNPEGHVAGMRDFWNHAQKVAGGKISRVRLVIATTETLGFRSDQGISKKIDGSSNETQEHGECTQETKYPDARDECIQAIHDAIDDLEMDAATSDESQVSATVDFTLTMIKPTLLGYQELSRSLLRNSLYGHDANHHLSFDLPETQDGTQCCVSFDASFQTFPYAVDSAQASLLRDELRALTTTPLKMVQMVPLTSVDASLFHGVPLKLRSGMTSGGFDEFHEMDTLVRVLFRLLQDREQAILLEAPSLQQFFLLMAQEFPSSTQQSPQTGLLFRYANVNQYLAEATQARPNDRDEEMTEEYSVYVEEALTTLHCDSFNPLFHAAQSQMKEKSTMHVSASNKTKQAISLEMSHGATPMETEDDAWKDSSDPEATLEESSPAEDGGLNLMEEDDDVFIPFYD